MADVNSVCASVYSIWCWQHSCQTNPKFEIRDFCDGPFIRKHYWRQFLSCLPSILPCNISDKCWRRNQNEEIFFLSLTCSFPYPNYFQMSVFPWWRYSVLQFPLQRNIMNQTRSLLGFLFFDFMGDGLLGEINFRSLKCWEWNKAPLPERGKYN